MNLDFNFLKEGVYKVKCYRDPLGSDGSYTSKNEKKAPLVCDSITISSRYPQYFPVAEKGGFAFIIENSCK